MNAAGTRSHPYSRDDNSTELGKPSFELSSVKIPGECGSNSHVTAIEASKGTESGSDGRIKFPAPTGIHVRNDIVIS